MTAYINKSTVMGNLGADPEQKSFQNGGNVVRLRVATTEFWTDSDQARRSVTEWHHVTIFNDHFGKLAMKYLRKGSAVYVEGQLRTRKYTDNQGIERRVTEIVVPKFKGELLLMDPRQGEADRPADGKERAAGGSGSSGDIDDEVPF